MVRASHCVGLTLPGMMLLPGSFSGRLSSPRPQRGPLPRKRMSFATCQHSQFELHTMGLLRVYEVPCVQAAKQLTFALWIMHAMHEWPHCMSNSKSAIRMA